MELKEDMTFEWQFSAEGKQRYLLKKRNNDRHVEAVLNELLIAAPQSTAMSPFGIGACHVNSRSAKDLRALDSADGEHRTCMSCAPSPRAGVLWSRSRARLIGRTSMSIWTTWRSIASRRVGCCSAARAWNTLDKSGTMPVNNLAGWANYVSEIVKHAKQRIHRWEVWNEPAELHGQGSNTSRLREARGGCL